MQEGSTVVSTVKDTHAATSTITARRLAVADQWEGHPPAWPKYQTRKVWNDSQTPPRQKAFCTPETVMLPSSAASRLKNGR